MTEDTEDRRLFARYRAKSPAYMVFNNQELPCCVLDVSAGGVQIKADRLPAPGDSVVLRFGTIGEVSATVAWQHGDRCGLQFTDDEVAVSELVMALAIYG